MNVDLSRRVGRIMIAPVIGSLSWEDRLKFQNAVAAAKSFTDLAERWRQIIEQAETEIKKLSK